MTITINFKFLVDLTLFIACAYASFNSNGTHSVVGFMIAIAMLFSMKDSYRDFITISE
jgi:hypothetical protein